MTGAVGAEPWDTEWAAQKPPTLSSIWVTTLEALIARHEEQAERYRGEGV